VHADHVVDVRGHHVAVAILAEALGDRLETVEVVGIEREPERRLRRALAREAPARGATQRDAGTAHEPVQPAGQREAQGGARERAALLRVGGQDRLARAQRDRRGERHQAMAQRLHANLGGVGERQHDPVQFAPLADFDQVGDRAVRVIPRALDAPARSSNRPTSST
jgi:hypothetical protein